MGHSLWEGGGDTGEGERREGVDKPLGEGVEGEKGKKGKRDRVLGLVPAGTLLYAGEDQRPRLFGFSNHHRLVSQPMISFVLYVVLYSILVPSAETTRETWRDLSQGVEPPPPSVVPPVANG